MTSVMNRLVPAMGIWAALTLGLSGCAWGGKEVNTETNLANQRKAAMAFLETQGGVEQIRFTQEGGKPGLGASWRANAVITIAGVEYQEIVGIGVLGGDPLPGIVPSSNPSPATLIFSDGSSEVIE